MSRSAIGVCLAIVSLCLAGCVAPEDGAGAPATSESPGESVTPSAASTEQPPTTISTGTGTPTTNDPVSPCATGEVPFGPEGVVAAFGEPSGDAAVITGLRWTIEDLCERFVVDLATSSGSPAATIGETTVELRPGAGIVRLALPDEVTASALARVIVDGRMVTDAYVIQLVDGGLAVDLHVDALNGVEARSFLAASPARVVVDLRPVTDAPAVTPPNSTAGLVLLEPGDGPADYPFEVVGYVAAGTSEVAATLGAGSSGEQPIDLTVASSEGLWREYAARLTEGPSGSLDLVVVAGPPDDPLDQLSVVVDVP